MGKEQSAIQWTDWTWNIARGCGKVDADCKFCYMYRDSFDGTRYNPREIVRTKTVFNLPLKIKETKSSVWSGKPLVFTSSLTDVFHPAIDSYRNEMWDIIRKCPHLIFQILTKRPERILQHLPEFWDEIKDHVWLGTSVGHMDGLQRILELRKLRKIAPTLFLSLEPMHGEMNLRWKYAPPREEMRLVEIDGEMKPTTSQHELLMNFDWVIIGGESGNDTGKYRYRPCKLHWLTQVVTHCKEAGVPVFVKQMGTYLAKERKMSDRHGSNIAEFPDQLQLREFPKQKSAK